MELNSSNVNEKELNIVPDSGQEAVADESLCRNNMEENSDRNLGEIKHPSDPAEVESKLQEQKGDREDVKSDLFHRGWSKTGQRRRNSTRARVNMSCFLQDKEVSRPGDESEQPGDTIELPLKKRKMSDSPVSITGNKIIEPGDYDPGAERAVARVNRNNVRHNEYVCDLCYRSFRSYQALGGHKAHHSYDKAGDVSFMEEKSGSSHRPRNNNNSNSNNQVYQCTLCNKIFSKGQALGGHKRHCLGQASHGGGQHETEIHPPVLDFDLNELPPEWITED